MPGGMGGLGQLFGMLGGMGRMGGMGGGVGGMGGMPQPGGAPQARQEQTVTDEYDLDRWRRAGGEDETALEQVRADWDEKAAQKKKRASFFQRLGKKKPAPPAGEEERPQRRPPAPAAARSGTAVQAVQDEAAASPAAAPVCSDPRSPAVGRFFRENPVNSTLLAMDSLSLGPLVLNQLSRPAPGAAAPENREESEEGYMAARRETAESRKYHVRIVD